MVKPFFLRWLLAALVAAVTLAVISSSGALCQDKGMGDAGCYNQQGKEYFEKGFYGHAPKKQVAEAMKNYGLAVKAFKAAISREPSFIDAHRNLARVYFVQKNFAGAAEEYKRVAELAPNDLDAYVNRALALVELKRDEEAVQTLESAKRETTDTKVLEMLDAYIARVRALREHGVR